MEIKFWSWELVLLPINNNYVFWGILSPIFLCFFCQDKFYNPRLYMFLMYLTASNYSREDRCNPLLLIVEVWIRLSPMVFLFAFGGFPRKNSSVWFIFLLHEFIYLLLLVTITYLILHKEMVEKSWGLLEYCEFTLTSGIRTKLISNGISCVN